MYHDSQQSFCSAVLADLGGEQKTLGGEQKTRGGEQKTDHDTLVLEETQRCLGSPTSGEVQCFNQHAKKASFYLLRVELVKW